jgi:hypothetical protein
VTLFAGFIHGFTTVPQVREVPKCFRFLSACLWLNRLKIEKRIVLGMEEDVFLFLWQQSGLGPDSPDIGTPWKPAVYPSGPQSISKERQGVSSDRHFRLGFRRTHRLKEIEQILPG